MPTLFKPSTFLPALWIAFLGIVPSAMTTEPPRLVLALDDGYANWMEIVAPLLQEAEAKATAYVNNQNIPGRLKATDLQKLQNDYNWEIGTHTFHHHNAVSFVSRAGLDTWVQEELDTSLKQFAEWDLRIHNLAFPFNHASPELKKTVQAKGLSYRNARSMAMITTLPADGSFPATSLDISSYVPPQIVKKWMELTARRGAVLSVYAHRILPDEWYRRRTVVEVEGNRIRCDRPLNLPDGEPEWVLVPDVNRRLVHNPGLTLEKVEGADIWVRADNLQNLTAPGATCMIGPAYSTPLADLNNLITTAKELHFQWATVQEVLTQSADPSEPSAEKPSPPPPEEAPIERPAP